MPSQREQKTGQLQPEMPEMLYGLDSEYRSQQNAGKQHAGSDSKDTGRTWPGKDIGVREPSEEETPLSWAEIQVGIIKGVL